VDDLGRQKVSDRITLLAHPGHGHGEIVQKAMVKRATALLARESRIGLGLSRRLRVRIAGCSTQMVEITFEAFPARVSQAVWFISPVLNEDAHGQVLNIATEQKLKPEVCHAVIRAELLADGKPAPTGVEGQWSCPMHPLVVLPQGGECPVCKMKLVQIPGTPASATAQTDRLLLAVPVTAVLDSGVRKLVYVEKDKGQFSPVEIMTGPRTDDSYPS
jgi:Cu(I)/Ag(I) efflux system membrane fusion protein